MYFYFSWISNAFKYFTRTYSRTQARTYVYCTKHGRFSNYYYFFFLILMLSTRVYARPCSFLVECRRTTFKNRKFTSWSQNVRSHNHAFTVYVHTSSAIPPKTAIRSESRNRNFHDGILNGFADRRRFSRGFCRTFDFDNCPTVNDVVRGGGESFYSAYRVGRVVVITRVNGPQPRIIFSTAVRSSDGACVATAVFWNTIAQRFESKRLFYAFGDQHFLRFSIATCATPRSHHTTWLSFCLSAPEHGRSKLSPRRALTVWLDLNLWSLR